jgi:hypothetical protein
MKRNIIVSSHSITLTLVTDTEQESEAVSSPFGPVKAGLITSQGTLGAQHTELLNYCLRSLEILQSRYYTDSNTLKLVTKEALAGHLLSTIETDGTNENWS